MDIKILHSHLKDHLDTRATAKEIAKALTNHGPTVDRLHKKGKDYLYEIEVTTNRPDAMSVRGIAREAVAALTVNNKRAKLKPLSLLKTTPPKKGNAIKIIVDRKLTNRAMALVFDDIQNWETPKWMKDRLAVADIRSINLPVDITNYVMLDVGHPMHVFDYDLITTKTLKFRESESREKITSFDGNEYTLSGGDIVIDNGEGEIIDLPGIIGIKNSVVNKDTKKILLFVNNNNPKPIRKTSLDLEIRTLAAQINEKGPDSELAEIALKRAAKLFIEIAQARVASKITDVYPNKPKKYSVSLGHDLLESYMGLKIKPSEVAKILKSLEINAIYNKKTSLYKITPPSFRSDLHIDVDVVEEIARIYGYYKLPSELMAGKLPGLVTNSQYKFENRIRETLKGLGGYEVYTLSLVDKKMAGEPALKLLNPLGVDTKYLRTSLKPSLIKAIQQNKGQSDPLHLFEIANVYIPMKTGLPIEKMVLAGVFANYELREAKGIVEALLKSLNIKTDLSKTEFVKLKSGKIYYEFGIEKLMRGAKSVANYIPLPKYPPQIEDITFKFPEKTMMGEVLSAIKSANKFIDESELISTYKNAFTFRVWYQNPDKTMTDKEVSNVRRGLISKIEKKFGGVVKD